MEYRNLSRSGVIELFKRRTEDQCNKSIAAYAVLRCGELLEFASPELRDDPDVVLNAITGLDARYALQFASDRLRDDVATVIAAVEYCVPSFEFASERIKDDDVIVDHVMRNCWGMALPYVSERLRNDEAFVFAQIRRSIHNMQGAPFHFRSNPEFVLKACEIHPSALHYAPLWIQDKKFIARVLAINWKAIHYVPYRLQRDKDLMILAVSQSRKALKNRELGISEDYMRLHAVELLTGHAFWAFLLGARRPSCVLSKLNGNGFYHALRFRHLVAEFAGVKMPSDGMTVDVLCRAVANLTAAGL